MFAIEASLAKIEQNTTILRVWQWSCFTEYDHHDSCLGGIDELRHCYFPANSHKNNRQMWVEQPHVRQGTDWWCCLVRHGRTPLLTVLFRDGKLITSSGSELSFKYVTLGFAYYTCMLGAYDSTSTCRESKSRSFPATSVGNLIIYTALPASRKGLLNSMLQLLRSTMSITGARILLNVRGVISTAQESWPHAVESLEVSNDSSPSSNSTSAATDSIELCPPVLIIGRSGA